MQKEKTSQQTFLLLSLIFVILLISFFSYQKLSGQAITDRSGTRALSSLPSQQQMEDTGSTSLVAGGGGNLPDSDCKDNVADCKQCPCDASVDCDISAFIPGKTCNTGGVKDYLKSLCEKVVADTNKQCLDSTGKCEALRATPNHRCEGNAGQASPSPGECLETQVVEYEYDARGKIKTRADGTYISRSIRGVVLQCASSCPLYCTEVRIAENTDEVEEI